MTHETLDLLESFARLQVVSESDEFDALELGSRRRDFLTKDQSGLPVFLLADDSSPEYFPRLNFRYLTAEFHVTCRVRLGSAVIEGQFCVVSCTSAVSEMHEIFISCIAASVESFPEVRDTALIEQRISRLRDLFRALTQPGGREIGGMWAELLLILYSNNIPAAVASWHEQNSERFDFSLGAIRVEVKFSSRSIRAHEFSIGQLEPGADGLGYIFSVSTQPLSGGVGVLNLARTIDQALRAPGLEDARRKLWLNIAKALGSEFCEKVDKRFDPELAVRHMRVYSMRDIPRPHWPCDPRITAMRFTVDLTDTPSSLDKRPLDVLRTIFGQR